jgi:hypothetical protein
MNRQIIRRFLPLSQEFDLCWTEMDQVMTQKKSISKYEAESSHEEFADATCNCFAVSPKGTFLIAVVNEEILQLKYLPAGMISELRDSVQPYYYKEDA